MKDLAAFRALRQAAGFRDAEIIDAREECTVRFLRSSWLTEAIDRETSPR